MQRIHLINQICYSTTSGLFVSSIASDISRRLVRNMRLPCRSGAVTSRSAFLDNTYAW